MTDSVMGYCAAIVPDLNFWQAVFITQEAKHLGERLLTGARRMTLPPGMKDTQVLKPQPDISGKDQVLLGTFCAVFVDGLVRNEQMQVAAASHAILQLTGTNYFVVYGTPSAEGFHTTFEPMPATVSTPDRARDFLNGLPVVQKMKDALVAELKKGARN